MCAVHGDVEGKSELARAVSTGVVLNILEILTGRDAVLLLLLLQGI